MGKDGWAQKAITWLRRRPYLLSCVAGVLTALALPPLSWLWVLPIAGSLIFILWSQSFEGGNAGRRRFYVGWAYGAGFFSAGLYWVAYAFLVEAAVYGWMIPFAIGGLGVGLGLFSGAAFWVAGFSANRPFVRWVSFACIWMLMEWVRGWIFTGFPWNAFGVVWAPYALWSQGASVFGMFGLSLLTMLMMTAPAAGGLGAFGERSRWVRGGCVVCVILGLQALGGWMRLPAAPMAVQPDVRLRIVQPNIPQAEKWIPSKRLDNLYQQIRLSQSEGWNTITHVIWPETASTYPLLGDAPAYRNLVAQAAPRNGWLLTGAPRRTERGSPLRIWNSLFAIDAMGGIGDIYDKSHLVPFGEYVPLAEYIPLGKLTSGRVDFTPGPGVRTVKIPNTPPYSPLICYEIIFPGKVVDPSSRPQWLLNVTNDAWFGMSAGPHQHFAMATLRAVEEGLPVVRVANTGISGVIDPYGRVTSRLGLGHRGKVDVQLPQPLVSTVFSLFGNQGPILFAVLMLCILNGGSWLRRSRSR